jgi:hypothetical protein
VFEQRSLGLAVGDRVRITQNGRDAKGARLNNGSVYTLDAHGRGGTLVLRDMNGHTRTLDAEFGHLAYGYVTTSHAAQGRTVDHVFIAQSAVSFPASSREQFYVSASRGRLSVQFYTDSADELRDAVARSGERMSAGDVARAADEAREKAENDARRKARVKAFQKQVLGRARRALFERWREEDRDWAPPPPIIQGRPAAPLEPGRGRGFEPGR